MANVMENIRAMREKAKASEVKYYSNKFGANLSLSDLKEGDTVLRIAPSLSDEFPSAFVPFRSTYLEIELEIDQMQRYQLIKTIEEKKLEKKFGVDKTSEIKDDQWDDDKLKNMLKKLLGESFTMKFNKRTFIATLHAKQEGLKDLVEEYIKAAIKKVNSECGDKEEAKKLLGPIFGSMDRNKKWIPGITPSTNFVCYCWDWSDSNKPFYKFEFYDKQMKGIEELYIDFDKGDEPLTVDPFSHEEEGIGIQFTKRKNEKDKWEYIPKECKFNPKKFKTYQEFVDQYKLTDEQLTQLKEVKSLQELFGRGSFKSFDFKIQLSGLVLFDEKHGYEMFQNDDFLQTVEEIASQFSETEEEVKEEKAKETKSGKDIDRAFQKKTEVKEESKGVDFKKALTKKKEVVPIPEPEDESGEAEEDYSTEDSFCEEEPEQEVEKPVVKSNDPMSDKLAALRMKLGNKLGNKK